MVLYSSLGVTMVCNGSTIGFIGHKEKVYVVLSTTITNPPLNARNVRIIIVKSISNHILI